MHSHGAFKLPLFKKMIYLINYLTQKLPIEICENLWYNEIMDREQVLKSLAVSKTERQTSELKVFTIMRKLLGYIVGATEKSPKKFKSSFVDKLRNLAISANGNLVRANLCRLDDEKRKQDRKTYQVKAFEDLKELESLSFLALECKCILAKQYNQISIQICDALKYLTAWMKSDKERFKKED